MATVLTIFLVILMCAVCFAAENTATIVTKELITIEDPTSIKSLLNETTTIKPLSNEYTTNLPIKINSTTTNTTIITTSTIKPKTTKSKKVTKPTKKSNRKTTTKTPDKEFELPKINDHFFNVFKTI